MTQPPRTVATREAAPRWPCHGGEMAARIRAHDWAATPLGPSEAWPQSLRTAIDLCLGSGFASFVWWGEELVQLYNDAALAIVRGKHPAAFAAPARSAWSDVWPVVGPLIDGVLDSGEPALGEDLPMVPDRDGSGQPAYFTFCYSALRDERGAVAGLFITTIETTAKVQAEAARRESKRRLQQDAELAGLLSGFRALFEAAPSPLLVVAPSDFRIVAVNNAYLEATRTRRADLLGQPLFEAFPDDPDDPAADGVRNLRASLQRVLATRRPDAMPVQRYPIRRDSGPGEGFEERWWKPVNSPVLDKDGQVALVIHDVDDMTERMRAEEALRQSEQRFRLMADAVPQIVWITDADGHTEFFNRQWTVYTGKAYEPTTAAQVAATAVHPDDRALTLERFDAARRTGGTFEVEHRIRSAAGDYRWFLVRAEPHRDPESGRIVRWFGASVDIHDRRLAEEALRASEARQRFLLRLDDRLRPLADPEAIQFEAAGALGEHLGASRVGYAEAQEDRETIVVTRHYTRGVPGIEGRYRYDDYGPALLRRLESGHTLVHADIARDATLSDAEKAAHAAHQIGAAVQVPLVKSARLVAVLFVHYREAHAPSPEELSLLEAVAERTWGAVERAKAEEALRVEDRRKDEFLATLAHELRNPLAPLRTGLQILRLSPAAGAGAAKTVETMERQLSHLVRLVDDLLDVSRIRSGKVELRREQVTLLSVLDSAIETSRPAVEAGRHELTLHLPHGPLHLHADPTRLTQVLGNLLHNAAKYTPDGGRIDVSAAREGEEAVVRVTDSGIGIAPEMLPQVFEMFTQIGKATDRAQGGLGIGLSLSRRLIEMHGGRIEAASPGIGLGSTFTVRLPLAPALHGEDEVAERSSEERPATPSLKVLVVDDNADAADTLAMMLELLGHEARTAYSGPQALRAAREFRPAILLCDIGMPGMSGYEVARQVREDPALARTRLAALTGWGSEDDKRQALAAGFDHHFTKPVDAGALQALLGAYEGPRT